MDGLYADDNFYEKLKPFIKDFIAYYYNDLGQPTGGRLHIVLDDGNISHDHIFWCQQECEKHGDTFGYFLSTLMRSFTEEELREMYEDNHWGMKSS